MAGASSSSRRESAHQRSGCGELGRPCASGLRSQDQGRRQVARLVQALPSLAPAWAGRRTPGGALPGPEQPVLEDRLQLGVRGEVAGTLSLPILFAEPPAPPRHRQLRVNIQPSLTDDRLNCLRHHPRDRPALPDSVTNLSRRKVIRKHTAHVHDPIRHVLEFWVAG
jgi:hypothetical protein